MGLEASFTGCGLFLAFLFSGLVSSFPFLWSCCYQLYIDRSNRILFEIGNMPAFKG